MYVSTTKETELVFPISVLHVHIVTILILYHFFQSMVILNMYNLLLYIHCTYLI